MAKTKQKKPSDLSKILNAINRSKEPLTSEEILAVPPFIINRMMSLHPDTIFYAYQMSLRSSLDPLLQHAYYIHAVDKASRFAPMSKRVKLTDDVKLVQKHFKLSRIKAIETMALLSEPDMTNIQNQYDEGG